MQALKKICTPHALPEAALRKCVAPQKERKLQKGKTRHLGNRKNTKEIPRLNLKGI